MTTEEIQNLASGYALEALSNAEFDLANKLIAAKHPAFTLALQEMDQVKKLLPFATTPEKLPSSSKQAILALISEKNVPEKQKPSNETVKKGVPDKLIKFVEQIRFWKRLTYGVSFAGLLLILGAGWYISLLKSENNLLAFKTNISQQLIDNLQTELKDSKKALVFVSNPKNEIVKLAKTKSAQGVLDGTVFISPENQTAYFTGKLASLSSDQDYHLWMLKGNQPISVGVLTVDSNGLYSHEFEIISKTDLTALAISLEPKGGSPEPAPTGPVYMVGLYSGS